MNLRRMITGLVASALLTAAFGGVGLGAYVVHLAGSLPAVSPEPEADDTFLQLPLATEVYDRSGKKLGEIFRIHRYYVSLSEMPQHLIDAFVAAEDEAYFDHFGISPRAILRSAYANLRGMAITQGGSTITQQLARLSYLNAQRTWPRKIKEALMALALEGRYSKEEILELYLNRIYLGNRAYGVEAAARRYFGKSVGELDVGESAVLAGLPKAPSRYAPHDSPQKAKRRQTYVLRRMAECGFLSEGEAKKWIDAPLGLDLDGSSFSEAGYVLAEVKRELQRKFEYRDLATRGLQVHTSIDKTWQSKSAEALKAAVKKAGSKARGQGRLQGAWVSLDPETGAVRALHGGTNYRRSQFNRAYFTRRRIGSLFGPVTVSMALTQGRNLATPVSFRPFGDSRATRGKHSPSLYEAAMSPDLRALAPLVGTMGLGSLRRQAKRFGFRFERRDLQLAFGYGKASPVRVARAYSVFFGSGVRPSAYLIEKVATRSGEMLFSRRVPVGERVLTPQNSFIMRRTLRDKVRHGDLAGVFPSERFVAGVAGQSPAGHDSWFAGYAPRAVSAVWVGAERGRARLASDDGQRSLAAAEAFRRFVTSLPAPSVDPREILNRPSGITYAGVPGLTRKGRPLPFLEGQEPGRRRF